MTVDRCPASVLIHYVVSASKFMWRANPTLVGGVFEWRKYDMPSMTAGGVVHGVTYSTLYEFLYGT